MKEVSFDAIVYCSGIRTYRIPLPIRPPRGPEQSNLKEPVGYVCPEQEAVLRLSRRCGVTVTLAGICDTSQQIRPKLQSHISLTYIKITTH